MKQLAHKLIQEDSGQDLIEYALVAALVALGSVSALKGVANSVGSAFNGVNTQLANA
jgi:pilus assembly protein Flp/PilA